MKTNRRLIREIRIAAFVGTLVALAVVKLVSVLATLVLLGLFPRPVIKLP